MAETTRLEKVSPVAIIGGETDVGRSVLPALLDAGIFGVALFSCRETAAAYAQAVHQGRLKVVWGRMDNLMRLHSLLVIHEVTALFYFGTSEPNCLRTLHQAVGRYTTDLPVIVCHRQADGQEALRRWQRMPLRLGIVQVEEIFGPGLVPSTQTPCPDPPISVQQTELAPGLTNQPSLSADEQTQHDYVYVADLADALILMAQQVRQQKRSLCLPFRSGWRFTRQQWSSLHTMAAAGQWHVPEIHAIPSHPWGWRPRRTLEQALRETYTIGPTSRNHQDRTPGIGLRQAA